MDHLHPAVSLAQIADCDFCHAVFPLLLAKD
ncbi:MAG: hypothetical protein ACD_54C00477G0001 [uncultured bacterium]|nr:MAG: hypothetical protein ACD_54C00477G0001 [uncultured bacterium]